MARYRKCAAEQVYIRCAIMTDLLTPSPHHTAAVGWHRLQLHTDDDALTNNICRYLCAALLPGNAAIVVAKREHLGWVRDQAPEWNLDLERAEAEGRFVPVVAEETLPTLLVDGMPDRDKFRTAVAALQARVTAPHDQLNIYGEMVGMLLAQDSLAAMHRLEELWNELGDEGGFNLLCGYPAALLSSPERQTTLQMVCDHHHKLVG